MTIEMVIFCAFIVWATGGVLASIFDEFDHQPAAYIWWPLLLIKAALKGLWSVLFTDWKVKP